MSARGAGAAGRATGARGTAVVAACGAALSAACGGGAGPGSVPGPGGESAPCVYAFEAPVPSSSGRILLKITRLETPKEAMSR